MVLSKLLLVRLRFCPCSKGHTLSDSWELTRGMESTRCVNAAKKSEENGLFWIILDLSRFTASPTQDRLVGKKVPLDS